MPSLSRQALTAPQTGASRNMGSMSRKVVSFSIVGQVVPDLLHRSACASLCKMLCISLHGLATPPVAGA